MPSMTKFVFPTWTNQLIPVMAVCLPLSAVYVIAVGAYGTSPSTTNVGYKPEQPIPFSHKVHVGTLKMDCRYCHQSVDQAAHAAVPATQTCVNCHSATNPDGTVENSAVHSTSEKLLGVRKSQATGQPIEWERVHDLPDFVYFDHSAHVNRGVSCVSCHGRVDKMDVVEQVEPMSMAWCLDCHRNPDPHIRPQEHITDLAWEPNEPAAILGARIREQRNINPSTNCSTCHR